MSAQSLADGDLCTLYKEVIFTYIINLCDVMMYERCTLQNAVCSLSLSSRFFNGIVGNVLLSAVAKFYIIAHYLSMCTGYHHCSGAPVVHRFNKDVIGIVVGSTANRFSGCCQYFVMLPGNAGRQRLF